MTVTAAAGCGWTAASNAPWITINSGTTGSGNGTVAYTVAANTGTLRTGTITIAGQIFIVTQDAFVCPVITVMPTNLDGFVGSGYTHMLSASGGTASYNFTVSGGALPGGLGLSTAGVITGTPTNAGTFSFTIAATDANGCIGTRTYTLIISSSPGGLMFYPLTTPVRLLDTRGHGVSPNACTVNGNQPIAANTSLLQAARGICGIPANAAAVTGNVTTVTSGGGYLTIYPSGAARPTVTSINYNPNEIVNNVFTAGLGADGNFNIYALNTTDVVIDVTGYYAPPAAGGLYFHPLPAPVRLLETRAGQLVGCVKLGTPLPGNADSLQTATTACTGIPAAARAIVGNATTVSPLGGGYLTLFPADAARPLIASSNYDTDQIVNGPFTVGLSPSGQFKIFTLATTHLVVDVLGYYSAQAVDANGAGLLFTPLAHPIRLLETRNNPAFPGCFKPNAPLNGNQVYTQPARGLCDGLTIPTTALGVVGNATTVSPQGGGFLTLWPSSAAQPTVATANYNAGEIVNQHFIVGLSNADWAFKMFSFATTDLVIDLTGYFMP
ncbi:MAG: putative Ig domain-containing protein [Acidobacteriota bacterium]|nr:putative Ig domain-containing protein [Acidobacteriota bacterium]